MPKTGAGLRTIASNLFTAKLHLLTAGMIAVLVGLADVLVPIQNEAGVGVAIGNAPSLINELRASGGGLLTVGLFFFAGAFIAELTSAATLLASMVYLGFGGARLFSLVVDGLPTVQLLAINALEIAIGAWSLAVFLKLRDRSRV